MLTEDTATPAAALPLAQFKDHLRLGSGFADDGLQDVVLDAFLRAALAAIEGRTGKILMERAFSLTLGHWREVDRHPLPVAPVSAITGLVVMGPDEVEAVVSPALWRLEADMQRPSIVARGAMLPRVPHGGTARIGLMAGFGPDWSDLPADLAQAVLMLASHYYEYRHETVLGAGCMPFGVTALIERYRTVRLFIGGRA